MIANLAWLVGWSDELGGAESVADLWREEGAPESVELVYAPNRSVAEAIAYHGMVRCPRSSRVTPRALRYRAADHLAAMASRPGTERYRDVFRDLGWYFDDERSGSGACEWCGLYPFDLAEFTVIEDADGNRVCLRCRAAEWESNPFFPTPVETAVAP